MFRIRHIKTLILAAAAAAAAACATDPVFNEEGGASGSEDAEPASLTIDISIADIGIDVSTRTGTGTRTGTTSGARADMGGGTRASGMCGAFDKADLLDPDYSGPVPEPGATDEAAARYNEAAFINGTKMTCLTLILVHRRTNKIVGIRRIPDPDCPDNEENFNPADEEQVEWAKKNSILNEDGSLASFLYDENGEIAKDEDGRTRGMVGTRACVTFDYNDPIHIVEEKDVTTDADRKYIGQSAEKLLRGEYTVLAIANYDHDVTTSRTSAGEHTLNVDETLENIANMFHQPQYMAEGIPNFNPGYQFLYDLRFLMNRTLQKDGENFDVVTLPLVGPDGKPLKPYIRPAVHQTLTAAKDFYLGAGDNHMSLELLRISSRTRVEVKNYGSEPLQIDSLAFSPNYTQSTCYLFRRNKNNRDYSELASTTTGLHNDHDGKGAPMVDYTGIINPISNTPTYGAIVPFIKDWDSDNAGGADGVRVKSGEKRCIFDALMYESHIDYKSRDSDPDAFTYTIAVSYPTVNNYKTTDIQKIDYKKWVKDGKQMAPDFDTATSKYATENEKKDYIHNPTSADELYAGLQAIEERLAGENGFCYFLIQGVGSNKYLYEQEDGTLYAYQNGDVTLDMQDIDLKSFLWRLDGLKKEADGTYTCCLKNLRSGKHMPTLPQGITPTDESHMMSTDDTTSQKYKLGVNNRDNKGNTLSEYSVTFSNTFYDENNYPKEYYLSVWGVGEKYLSGWNVADQGCQYRLYPVAIIPQMMYVGTPRIEKTIELTAFSDATGYVEKVREIQRNDFIRILVEVSYNSKEGDFEFRVNSWNNRTGDVEFR